MENLIGKKFGMLTVVEVYPPRTGPVFHERSTALFECECGVSSVKTIKDVKSGKTKSCGCLSRKIDINGLVGKKFNMLTVIEVYAPKKGPTFNERATALLKCECGVSCIKTTKDVKNGKIKSCGCLSRVIDINDIVGKKFNRLTIVKTFPSKKGPTNSERPTALCECECGKFSVAEVKSIAGGNTKSCGCLKIEKTSKLNATHRMRNSPEYRTWAGMKTRCYNKGCKDYYYYGARGIKVCERWHDFKNFYEDMGPRPSKKHSIDRINNDGDYEPRNCRWVTAVEQCNNRRPKKRRELSA